MSEIESHHVNLPGCVLCAVRQLTEGNAPMWRGQDPNDSVSGVVLKVESYSDLFGDTVSITLAIVDGLVLKPVRVISRGGSLASQIEDSAPVVGDSMTVTYLGRQEILSSRSGRTVKRYQVDVVRGHH